TTPLLGGQNPRRTSPPNSRSPNYINYGNNPNNNNNTNLYNSNSYPRRSGIFNKQNNNNNSYISSSPPQRHWSEEPEDISTNPSLYGHQNTGSGHRRRGPPPPIHHPSELDAQRFSGQDRPTGLQRILCGCCCLPCRTAYYNLKHKTSKLEKIFMGIATISLLLAIGLLCAYVRAREAIPEGGKN
ncbi:hypothetical protein BX616_009180, partial [Lobosporangium transversale]